MQPFGDCSAEQTEVGYCLGTTWLYNLIHSSWMVQVSQTCTWTESLKAVHCRIFILNCIFLADYFQESWVSSNNCRYKYFFAWHSSFAMLFTCTPQARKFYICMMKAGLPWWANIHSPQVFSAVIIALTLRSVRTRSCGSKEFKGEGLIIALQLGD